MQVRQNGIVVSTIGASITGAGPTTVIVSLCNNIPFDLYWNSDGKNPQEIEVSIVDPFNDLIYIKTSGQGAPKEVLFTSKGECTPPTCPKPSNLLATNITQTTAELSWTENGSATQWEVYVVPEGTSTPVNGEPLVTEKPYYIANSNPFTVADLKPQTNYVYYVRAICSTSDISTWTILSPKTFVTKPLNDECYNATPINVNPTRVCTQKVSGNTLGATQSLPSINCAGTSDDDVWFSFVAENNIQIIDISNLNDNTVNLDHAVYSGDCSNLNLLYCSDANNSAAFNLVKWQTYWIRVYTTMSSSASDSLTFDICVSTPEPIKNDECTTAISVKVNNDLKCNNFTVGYIAGATTSSEQNTCIGDANDDVWFSFTANANEEYITLTPIEFSSSTNLNHAVYSGDCDNLKLEYCSVVSELTSVSNTFIIGKTYYIRVWSNSSLPQDIVFKLCVGTKHPPITTTTTQYTTEQLVKEVLVNNPCVTVSNITSSTGTNFGSVNGIGYFEASKSKFPISNGIILSTGDATKAPGPKDKIQSEGSFDWSGDTELDNIINTATGTNYTSRNATKLEFDFSSMNEFMSFNFLFASEEYGTYQCGYLDAFTFLLTDLETGITTNIAVIPGTTIPVSVGTIRNAKYNDLCTSENLAYFGDFYGFYKGVNYDETKEAPINFNGVSQLMTASSKILPNHPYHIKLVVADRIDDDWDTAIFIQGGSFSSGPPECTDKIKLVAFIDANNNGIKDNDEENFNYGSFVYQLNNADTPIDIASANGTYTIYDSNPANLYDFSYKINPENIANYSVSLTNFNDINIPMGSILQTLYFPVTVKQDYKDISITIIPVTEAVAGGSFTNKIVFTNTGTLMASGTLNFIKSSIATITNISQTGTTLTDEGFTFNFSNLMPNETRTIDVVMSLPQTINTDDILTSTAVISASSAKSSNGDNVTDSFTNVQKVVTFRNTSGITEAHTEKIPFNSFATEDYLTYTIRFQNTNTYNAISVRIENLLDTQLDPESIRVFSASHNYTIEKVNNKITFNFDYIYLVGAPQDEALSKGYVTFKIKLKPGFKAGDIIPNYAEIFFDNSTAVTTNTFNTEFVTQLSNESFTAQNIQLYPNPANNKVQISLNNTGENLKSIVFYDLVGKRVLSLSKLKANQSTIDVSALAKGLYMVEITTDSNLKMVKKLVIE